MGALTEAAVQSASFNAAVQTFYPVDISTANVTATLPTAPADKTQVECKVVKVNATPGTYTCTVACGGSDVINVSGGSTSTTMTAKWQSKCLQYAHSTAIWYEITGDAALGQALGAAKLGSDGTVGGPSGSALTSSVVTVSQANAFQSGFTQTFDGRVVFGSRRWTARRCRSTRASTHGNPVGRDERSHRLRVAEHRGGFVVV